MAEIEGLLELNPNDNQGMRYLLMGAYLAMNRLDGARRLFEKYDERPYTATWAWAYPGADIVRCAGADGKRRRPKIRRIRMDRAFAPRLSA